HKGLAGRRGCIRRKTRPGIQRGMMVHRNALKSALYPNSIAIVGASKDTTKRGYRSLRKLIEDGYGGLIYPVNPRETEILGHTCYARIADIPGSIDLALICTPAKSLPAIIEQCG